MNKKAHKNIKFSSISFLVCIFIFMVIVIAVVGGRELQNIQTINVITDQIKKTKVIEFVESQKTLSNIANLRRLIQVIFETENPKARRNAQLDAHALINESVFMVNPKLKSTSQQISTDIEKLIELKESINNDKAKLEELISSYNLNLATLLYYITNQPEAYNIYLNSIKRLSSKRQQDITSLLYDIFLSIESQTNDPNQLNMFSMTNESIKQIGLKKSSLKPILFQLILFTSDIIELNRIQNISHTIIASFENDTHKEYKGKSVRSIIQETERSFFNMQKLEQAIAKDVNKAQKIWQKIDFEVRTLRDSVRTDSENSIVSSLSSINDTVNKSYFISIAMYSSLVLLFFFCFIVFYILVVQPIRLTAQKLLDIKKGKLDTTIPPIYIKEISEIALLLEDFSVHLSELYSHADQLAEDVAIKHDLEEVMRAVFKASLDGYVVWNIEEVEAISPAALTLLETPNDHEFTKSWHDFGFNHDYLLKVLEVVNTQKVFRDEITLTTANNEALPCETTHLPIVFHAKPCVLTYIRDLRTQKRNEAALLIAKDQAEVATQAKSDFLARMSHEIRTPMNGVLGLTHIALQSSPSEKQKDLLTKIQSSAKILLGVINDILDFSKIESGKLTLENTSFSLENILNTMQDLLEQQAQSKNIGFNIIYDNEKTAKTNLIGDSLRLSQILLNLTGNAIKFTESGSVNVQVRTIEEDKEKLSLEFSIIDTGIGLSPEQCKNLFQPFVQADSSTTRKYGGTGLGLMISKLLVELMGGSLNIKSELNKGSTFYFTITCLKDNQKVKDAEIVNQEYDENLLQGKKLLVAEDNMINQEIIETLLEAFGIKVTLADNGQEAVEFANKDTFDCILLDIQMPVMDGLTATKNLRNSSVEYLKTVPIIAMTAHAMQEDIKKSMEAGMNDHLTKPINVAELKKCLMRFLK
ncbi:response regulator [Desulfovibrio litoralis]|uniref:Sensory/regulatory protein RpfC n=1 Tax=Desulfovibrio litoralis DSM 11393 TaxID=1121455 RepID=A0A1M7S5G9_9BACT|nr:response regulator [Desulfovibrio litoralis]SHN53929.1 His Kinase A (phospho-acceptor) domain-containing protein [Desulfovibrio litoralis DSM 11393]